MEPGSWTDHGQVVRSQSGAEFNSSAYRLPSRLLAPASCSPFVSPSDMFHVCTVDPNLVIDFDGELKLGFGSYWGGIYQIVLSSITTQMESPPGDHLAGGNGRPAEGGFTYQPPGSFYWYEFFSDGITPLQGVRLSLLPSSSFPLRLRHLSRHRRPRDQRLERSTRCAWGGVQARRGRLSTSRAIRSRRAPPLARSCLARTTTSTRPVARACSATR